MSQPREFPIRVQPQSRASLGLMNAPLQNAGLARQLDNRLANLSCIILRPVFRAHCCTEEFEIVEERNYQKLFGAYTVSNSFCECNVDGIDVTVVGHRDPEDVIFHLEMEPRNFCSSTISATIYCPPGNKIGRAIHNSGWFTDTFEVEDSMENISFLADSRRRAYSAVPDFEITTTGLLSLGRVSLNINNMFGNEFILRWFADDLSPQIRALGLGFLLFLQLRVGHKYRHRQISRRRYRGTNSRYWNRGYEYGF